MLLQGPQLGLSDDSLEKLFENQWYMYVMTDMTSLRWTRKAKNEKRKKADRRGTRGLTSKRPL